MIQPTVGRVVLFYPSEHFTGAVSSDKAPLPALISRVWNDRMINLGGFDVNGQPFGATSVQLLQGDETGALPTGHYAEWMPYQKGQAAKTEALEQKTATEAPAIGQPPQSISSCLVQDPIDTAERDAHYVAATAANQVPYGGVPAQFAKDVATVYLQAKAAIQKPAAQDVFRVRADGAGIVWLYFENGMVNLNDLSHKLGPITGNALRNAIVELVG